MILTDTLRSNLENEYDQTIKQVQVELEQLRFQSKKLLQEASKIGPEALRTAQKRLRREETERRERLARAQELKKQLEMLPNGREIVQSRVESEIEVKIGDHWDKIMTEAEIVVKDGIVVEIRE